MNKNTQSKVVKLMITPSSSTSLDSAVAFLGFSAVFLTVFFSWGISNLPSCTVRGS